MVKMREAIYLLPTRLHRASRDITFTNIFASAKTHFLHYKNEQDTRRLANDRRLLSESSKRHKQALCRI